RFSRDWSSDVCSSDLAHGVYAFPASCATPCAPSWVARTQFSPAAAPTVADGFVLVADYQGTVYAFDSGTGNLKWRGTVAAIPHEIGRASCRERVERAE